MKYIETLREGERVGEIYLCKSRQTALTKAGKPYETLILQDKTGMLDAKVWDPNSQGIDEFEALDYIDVVGDVTSFQGVLQLNVKRIRKVREGEYDPKDYLPVSEKDIDQMYLELTGFIQEMKNPYLKKLCSGFFLEDPDFERRFKFHSAAKSVHHGFVGGLLEHTLSVTKLCEYYTSLYPLLQRDLLLSAAMFHDIGKPQTLTIDPDGTTHNKKHPFEGEKITRKVMRRLKFDNDTTDKVTKLVLYHDYDIAPTEAGVRRAVNRIGEDIFPMIFTVRRADIAAQSDYMREEKLAKVAHIEKLYREILARRDAVTVKDLAISGNDLIAEGMPPGRQIGETLSALLERVLDDPSLNTKEILLKLYKEV